MVKYQISRENYGRNPEMRNVFRKRLMFSIVSSVLFLLVISVYLVCAGGTARATAVDANSWSSRSDNDPGHQILPTKDGWAAAEGGTTGGATASTTQVYTVSNREQLVQALGGDNTGADTTPKIIYIKGIINGNEDDAGTPLTCADYATNGYSLAAYLAAYDPTVWGTTAIPSGPLEDARHASQLNQGKRVKIYIPSNTTIIGAGGRVIGANFMVKGVTNVIIRNLQFENASDCFPQWDPTDGATGNWNSQYDNISIYDATHVWIDHNSFTDANQPDSLQPTYFGREYQQHDGALDMTNGTDLVTVSWNRFTNHDKTMLIGSTDNPTNDVGKLRITIDHNAFENTLQRMPRVRYGQVHIYNNYYSQAKNTALQYALGVGIASQIYAQNNFYALSPGTTAATLIKAFKGTAIHTEGDIVNGIPVDLLAAYNAANTTALSGIVDWTPKLYSHIDPTQAVPDLVRDNAGASSSITVSQDGKGDFSSVQAAINSIPVNNAMNTTIAIATGTYQEVLNVPSSKPYITLRGGSRRVKDTVIAFNNWSGSPAPGGGTLGTSGSATATFNASDFAASYITFANTFDPTSQPQTNQHQAVAVKTTGDRMIFDNDSFLGNQDTLYINTPSVATAARQLFTNSYIEGTIDFIFGRGTAVFDRDNIFIKSTIGTGPKMTAAATEAAQTYGFLIINSKVKSSSATGTAYLGRPWPATTTANAQVTVRDTWLPDALAAAPWQSWTSPPLPWQNVRFAEYNNRGPGAAVNADRPQLTPAQAALQTPITYLVGQDGWTPDTMIVPNR
jgi:pectate lyase